MRLVPTMLLCAGLTSGLAAADEFIWEWDRGDPGAYGLNDAGGRFESIRASYNDQTELLSWKLTFSNQKTDGITLVLSDGPNPKGSASELAILYVDARDNQNLGSPDPRMTAYAYNGQNSRFSFRDGDGDGASDGGDLIHSYLDDTWIQSLSVEDIGDKRVFDFTVDATEINMHDPLYPQPPKDDPGADPVEWFGIGWAENLGLWLHTYKGLDAQYDQDGALTRWDRKREGWFDGRDFTTEVVPVPLPGAAAMGLAGIGLIAGRRRR